MTIEEAKTFLDNLKVCVEEHPIVADWLIKIADRKTENSSEKPNSCECEPRKEQNFCGKCRYLYRDFKYGLSCYRLMDNEPCKYEERKDEPQTDCKTCKHKDLEGCEEPCLECKAYDLYEPQTERNE